MICHVRGHVRLQPRSQAVIFVPFTMAASSGYNNSDVVIVAAGRTPIGNLNGCLSSLKAHELGAMVIRDVLTRGNTPGSDVAEVIMGQVCTAGKSYVHTNTRLNPFCFSKRASIAWVKATKSPFIARRRNGQSRVVPLCACHAPSPPSA